MSQNKKTEQTHNIFERLSSFVSHYRIDLKTFWRSNRICINIDQFLQYCDHIRFDIQQQDVDTIVEEFPEELITVKGLCLLVSYWSTIGHNLSQFLQEKAKTIFETSNRKGKLERTKMMNNSSYIPRTDKSQISDKSTVLYNNHKRLMEYKSRQKRNELVLQKTIIRNQNEGEFQLMLKVAEINEICNKMKNQVAYTLSKEDNKPPVITENNQKTGLITEITEKVFLRKYICLKEEAINTVKVEKQTSQTELKKTLIETMHISEQLKRQIDLIKRKGITANTSK